jgi:hypothetical protein
MSNWTERAAPAQVPSMWDEITGRLWSNDPYRYWNFRMSMRNFTPEYREQLYQYAKEVVSHYQCLARIDDLD